MRLLQLFRRIAGVVALSLIVTMTSWSLRLDVAIAAAKDSYERSQRIQQVAELMDVDPLLLLDPDRYYERKRIEGQRKVQELLSRPVQRPEWFAAQQAVNLLVKMNFARSLHVAMYEACWQIDEILAELSGGDRAPYRMNQLRAFRESLAVLHGQTGLLIEADKERLAGDASRQPWLNDRLVPGDWSADLPPEILPGDATVPAASSIDQAAFASEAGRFQKALHGLIRDLDGLVADQEPTLLASLALVPRQDEKSRATRLHGKYGRFLEKFGAFMNQLFTPPAAEALSFGDCRINIGYPWGGTPEDLVDLIREKCGDEAIPPGSIFGPPAANLGGFKGSEHWTVDQNELRAILAMLSSMFGNDFLMTLPPMPGTEMSDPVNAANGNYLRHDTDLSVDSIGPPIAFTRVYNAQSDDVGPLGIGWYHNYQQHLKLRPDGNIIYVDDDATEHFVAYRNGSYITPPGRFFTLEDAGSGRFTMTMKGQMVHVFETAGSIARLIEQRDNNGNTVTLHYTGNLLSRVVDDAGRPALTFTYDANGFMQQLKEYWGRTYDYVVIDGELTEVYNEIGERTSFVYDQRGQMIGVEDAVGELEVRVYDGNGRLMSWVDKAGHPQLFSYTRSHDRVVLTDRRGYDRMIQLDDSGRAVASVDPQGNRLEASWTDDFMVSEFRDGQGNISTYEYDERGNQTKAVDALGKVVERTFHPVYEGVTTYTQKDSEGDPNPRVTSLDYGPTGNVDEVVNASGLNMTIVYGPKGVPVSMVDYRKIETTYDINLTTGFLESATEIDPVHGPLTTTYTYDSNGTMVRTEDPFGEFRTFVTDLRGRSLSASDGQITLFETTYDGMDRATASVDQYGNISTTEYDAMGRVTRSVSVTGEVSTMTYDPEGNILSMTDSDGTMRYTYDEVGQRLTSEDKLGNVTATQYCAGMAGSGCSSCGGAPPCGVIDALGNVTKFTLDRYGRQTAVEDPLGFVSRMEYDERGRQTAMIDAEGNRTEYEFDRFDNLLSVSLFDDGRELVTRYEYDALHQRTAFIDAEGNVTEYEYNQDGQKTAERRRADANFVQVTLMSYNARDLLDTMTLPDGNVIYHHYDGEGKLIGKSVNSRTGPYREFMEYDEFDRLILEGNDQVTFRNAYDVLGRLVSRTQRMAGLDRNFTLIRSYDIQNRPIAMTDHDGLVTSYRYDPMNRLVAMDTPAGEHRFSFDARGLRVGVTFPNDFTSVREIDDAGRILSIATTTKLGDPIATYAYELDQVGMRTAVNEVLAYPGGATENRRHTYEYDDLYRLREVDYDDNLGLPTERYTYDDAHNRTTLERVGVGTITYHYDQLDRLIETTGIEQRTYSYTPNGQVASETFGGRPTDYDWDIFGRLRTQRENGVVVGTYEYAPNGYRTFMDEGEATHFVLHGSNVLADVVGGTTDRRYVHGMGMDELYAVASAGESQYFHRDGLGSVVAVSDAAGAVVSAQAYSAWGERVDSATAGLDNVVSSRFGYTGREHGRGGVNYHRARYYQPTVGRWLSQDEWRGNRMVPSSLNRYGYANQSSVSFVDLTGYFSTFQKVLIGFAILATLASLFIGNALYPYFIGGHGRMGTGPGRLDISDNCSSSQLFDCVRVLPETGGALANVESGNSYDVDAVYLPIHNGGNQCIKIPDRLGNLGAMSGWCTLNCDDDGNLTTLECSGLGGIISERLGAQTVVPGDHGFPPVPTFTNCNKKIITVDVTL